MPDRGDLPEQTAALRHATGKMAAATSEMAATTGKMADSADRRTQLAADRTALAADRTYASWVRTGLAGTVLELFSAFCFAAAVWRESRPGVPPPQPDTRRIPRQILVTVNGILALVAVAALVSIWFPK